MSERVGKLKEQNRKRLKSFRQRKKEMLNSKSSKSGSELNQSESLVDLEIVRST